MPPQRRLALRPADDADSDAIDALSTAVKRARPGVRPPGMYFAGSDQEKADYTEKIPGAFGAIGVAVGLPGTLSARAGLRDCREPARGARARPVAVMV